jgi:hypothetical protein
MARVRAGYAKAGALDAGAAEHHGHPVMLPSCNQIALVKPLFGVAPIAEGPAYGCG